MRDREKARAAQARWIAKNPEHYKAIRAAGRCRNKASIKATNKRYRTSHQAAILAIREATREERNWYRRQWGKANPEKNREYLSERRRKLLSAPGSHTAKDIKNLFRLQRGMCANCHNMLLKRYHVDHVVALVNGGWNDRSNLQLLCHTCNCRKGRKDPLQFAKEQGRLI